MNTPAWMCWAGSGMIVALVARNPWVLVEALFLVLAVRSGYGRLGTGDRTTWLIRLAVTFGLVSVLFNVLTVHAGSSVFAHVPDSWPVIGGDLTWNAAAYGASSALALVILVLVGVTLADNVNWSDLHRLLPAALAPVAVTSSVAWSFLPQLHRTWQDVREVQALRPGKSRSWVEIVVPVLAGGLERALIQAEALEARGFGGQSVPVERSITNTILAVFGLSAFVAGGGLLIIGMAIPGFACGVAGVVAMAWWVRRHGPAQGSVTRYRDVEWSDVDRLVVVTSVVLIVAVIGQLLVDRSALVYSPYPTLHVPTAPLALMAALLLLLAPMIWPIPEATR